MINGDQPAEVPLTSSGLGSNTRRPRTTYRVEVNTLDEPAGIFGLNSKEWHLPVAASPNHFNLNILGNTRRVGRRAGYYAIGVTT